MLSSICTPNFDLLNPEVIVENFVKGADSTTKVTQPRMIANSTAGMRRVGLRDRLLKSKERGSRDLWA